MDGKTIWLRPETKERLEQIREKRETFDEVVWRLIKVYATIETVSDTLGPGHYLNRRGVVGTAEK